MALEAIVRVIPRGRCSTTTAPAGRSRGSRSTTTATTTSGRDRSARRGVVLRHGGRRRGPRVRVRRGARGRGRRGGAPGVGAGLKKNRRTFSDDARRGAGGVCAQLPERHDAGRGATAGLGEHRRRVASPPRHARLPWLAPRSAGCDARTMLAFALDGSARYEREWRRLALAVLARSPLFQRLGDALLERVLSFCREGARRRAP